MTTSGSSAAARVARVGPWGRFGAGMISAGLLALLVTSAFLNPNPGGYNTHTQLGLAPCGFAQYFNKPCFTCGMTTSFAHAANGEAGASFMTQPMGFLLALASSIGVWTSGYVAWTGSKLGQWLGSMMTGRVLWTVAALAGAAWVYKMLTWPG